MGARSRAGKGSKGGAEKGKAAVTKADAKRDAATLAAPKSLWAKAFDKDVELTVQEALSAAHWIRQATAVVVGTSFGVLQLKGAPAIMTYILVSALFPSALLSFSNELDAEEIAKVAPIQMEGMMPAMALFLLTWILSYTVFLPPSS